MSLHKWMPFSLALTATVATTILAQDPPREGSATNLFDAPPVVVTATRTDRAPEEIPARITIVTGEDLQRQGARNVVEALRDAAGLHVRLMNGNPAQAEISLRGFGENAHGRTLVLRDGQRLNSPDMAGVNWLQIPVSSIARIEVLEGPQSVLRGDHAVAGVVNIITHDETRPAQTDIGLQAGSYETLGASLATHQKVGDNRLTAGTDWQTSDGFRHNGDYDTINFRAGVETDVNETLRTTIFGSYDRMEYGLPGSLTQGQMRDDPRQTTNPDDESLTDAYNLNFSLRWLPDPDHEVNASLIYNRRETENDFVSWMSYSDTDIDSLTFTISDLWETTLAGRPNRLLGGIDLYYDRLEADRFGEQARSLRLLNAVVDKGSYGAYLSNETDLADKLTLALGGRFEQARYEADVENGAGTGIVDDSETHSVGALSASLNYRPAPAAKLYAAVASVYRLPFIDEQVSYYGFGSDIFYDNLDPEKGVSAEVGGTWRLAPEWVGEVNLYGMEMRDEVAYNPVTGGNENLDKTRHLGASASLGWQRENLGALRLRYTFTRATFREGPNDGNDVPLVPNHHLAVTGRAHLPLDLTLLATLNVCANQYVGGDNANSAETLSSYTTLDLGLRYTPARLPDLALLVGVDNVFDESYANVAYAGFMETGYYPAPGRTWKSALTYSF